MKFRQRDLSSFVPLCLCAQFVSLRQLLRQNYRGEPLPGPNSSIHVREWSRDAGHAGIPLHDRHGKAYEKKLAPGEDPHVIAGRAY